MRPTGFGECTDRKTEARRLPVGFGQRCAAKYATFFSSSSAAAASLVSLAACLSLVLRFLFSPCLDVPI